MRPAKRRELVEGVEDTSEVLLAHVTSLLNNEPNTRGAVSEAKVQDFLDAREDKDMQKQLDILFQLRTGIYPEADE